MGPNRTATIGPAYTALIVLIAGSLVLLGLTALLGWGPIVLWVAVAGECVGWVLLGIKATRDRRQTGSPEREPSGAHDGEMSSYFRFWAPATLLVAGVVIVAVSLGRGLAAGDWFGTVMGVVIILLAAGLFLVMRVIHRRQEAP